jgi:hypothetical protein
MTALDPLLTSWLRIPLPASGRSISESPVQGEINPSSQHFLIRGVDEVMKVSTSCLTVSLSCSGSSLGTIRFTPSQQSAMVLSHASSLKWVKG